MDLAHGPIEALKFRPGLAALLKLTLEPVENVLEGKATLPRRSHASTHSTHASDSRLHARRGAPWWSAAVVGAEVKGRVIDGGRRWAGLE